MAQSQQMNETLKARCQEILDWDRTGLLVDGELRKMAEGLAGDGIPEDQKLRLAEQKTTREAMHEVIRAALSTGGEPDWWRWRYMTPNNGWSKWIALNADEVSPFRDLQYINLDAGKVELQPLYAALPTPKAAGDVPRERRFLIDALDALEAIDSEIVLTGHLKELTDCALAARNADFSASGDVRAAVIEEAIKDWLGEYVSCLPPTEEIAKKIATLSQAPATDAAADPRCDCGHLFEICNAPNCESGHD